MPDNPEEDQEEDVSAIYLIPGLPCLSRRIGVGVEKDIGHLGTLERDLQTYIRKSEGYLTNLLHKAKVTQKMELEVPDPLTFWISQVRLSC